MLDTQQEIAGDRLAVGLIDAVPTLLQVLCENTGMGFAAVARVTENSWTACAVRDQINFGLLPGDQLDVASTLCREVREARAAIVIENVSSDPIYCNHHTPKIYGIESYISVPIITANGSYFGNLCAIDRQPAKLSDPRTVLMFTRFAQLIAAQLDLKNIQDSSYAAVHDARAMGELRDLFVAILGHDLRSPARAILSEIEQLESSKLTAGQLAITARVGTHTRRIASLIADVLDFSQARLGSGLPVRLKENLAIGTYLQAAIVETLSAHPGAKIISNIAIGRGLLCDANRLQQLACNLLGNALTHGSPLGPVSFIATVVDMELCIEVWNSGEPIPAESLEQIFQPFWRDSTALGRQGVGLGLHICWQIVRAHDGEITATSSRENGTLLVAKIPLTPRLAE